MPNPPSCSARTVDVLSFSSPAGQRKRKAPTACAEERGGDTFGAEAAAKACKGKQSGEVTGKAAAHKATKQKAATHKALKSEAPVQATTHKRKGAVALAVPVTAASPEDGQAAKKARRERALQNQVSRFATTCARRRQLQEQRRAVETGVLLHGYVRQRYAEAQSKGGWEAAWEESELVASKLYPELLSAFQALLPHVGAAEAAQKSVGDLSYMVLQLRGRSVACGCQGEDEPSVSAKMALQRKARHGRARDALCAVMSALAARKEMSWIEAYGGERPARGYFAHSLADPRCEFRFACVGTTPKPASLLLLSRMPLRAALDAMDSDGPLRAVPSTYWRSTHRQQVQFALQELTDDPNLGSDDPPLSERGFCCELTPDARIKQCLLSSANVLVVDAFVALAPRAVAAAEGLSKIVCQEFVELLQQAKADGVPVVLQIGGSYTHLLARKVYMRQAFSQFGLRCGYIRWRRSERHAWEREAPLDDRCCVAIQLP